MTITYRATCLHCNLEQEYKAKITERETAVPTCPKCKEKMKPVFIANENYRGFILNGDRWANKKGY